VPWGRSEPGPTPAGRPLCARSCRCVATTSPSQPQLSSFPALQFCSSSALQLSSSPALQFNFDTYEKSIGALAGDPPRADFHEFSKPAVGDVPRVEPSGELTAAAADRINAVARDLVTVNAYLAAAIVALDRHGGAVKAGDRVWATRQAHALTHLKREAGLLSLKVAEGLAAIDASAPANEARTQMLEGMQEIGAHFASLPDIGSPW
jgi:hypothetical protein